MTPSLAVGQQRQSVNGEVNDVVGDVHRVGV